MRSALGLVPGTLELKQFDHFCALFYEAEDSRAEGIYESGFLQLHA